MELLAPPAHRSIKSQIVNVILRQALRVECVDARWSSVHQQKDDALRLWREMGRLGGAQIDRCGFGHQRPESEKTNSRSGLAKKRAPGKQAWAVQVVSFSEMFYHATHPKRQFSAPLP